MWMFDRGISIFCENDNRWESRTDVHFAIFTKLLPSHPHKFIHMYLGGVEKRNAFLKRQTYDEETSFIIISDVLSVRKESVDVRSISDIVYKWEITMNLECLEADSWIKI